MATVPAPRRPMGAAALLLLGCWWCATLAGPAAGATSPDSAGLVGSSPERPTLPFKLWARSPKTAVKPRRRDLREADLRRQLGEDFDPRWMRTRAHYGAELPDGPRQSVLKLGALAAREALPEELPAAAREAVRQWLVRRATCPVSYAWADLGPYFWPRWVRRGQCSADDGAPSPTASPDSTAAEEAAAARNASGEGGGAEAGPRPCSWPPGMRCVPSAAKVLQLLRWHCRLRKSALSNSVWMQPADRKKKRRKRFRCQWLKVPYPVPEDCTCA